MSLRDRPGALNNGITRQRERDREHGCVLYIGCRNCFTTRSTLGDEHVVEAICNFVNLFFFLIPKLRVYLGAGRCS